MASTGSAATPSRSSDPASSKAVSPLPSASPSPTEKTRRRLFPAGATAPGRRPPVCAVVVLPFLPEHARKTAAGTAALESPDAHRIQRRTAEPTGERPQKDVIAAVDATDALATTICARLGSGC
ncbi:MAG: hypothetical protein IIT36_00060 [Aeriscardovia sp.]|nr:hypothetical protein [Aeriscardovia sp.]